MKTHCRPQRPTAARCLALAGATLALALALLSPGPARAQTEAVPPPASPPSAASAASSATAGTAFEVIAATPIDIGAPDSPRASLAHYFSAVRNGRWDEATRYLVLAPEQQAHGPALARRLKAVIDDTGWIDLETLSDSHDGHADDGLPKNLDEVARINLTGRTEVLRMVRRTDAIGIHWAFSPSTVNRIDDWYAALPDRWLRDIFVRGGMDFMLLPGPLELLWWQWCAALSLLGLAWLGGSVLGRVTRWVLQRGAARTATPWDDELVASLGGPITLAWTLGLVIFGSRYLMLLRPAHHLIDGLNAAVMAFTVFWALWRGTGVASRQWRDRPWARESASARTLISVGGNFARGTIVFAGVLAVLSALGYSVSGVLAGLGIGGLALAFGAQKTIENLFGSVAIAVDQPFRVGDVVNVDGITGEVENIGLRSSRLRTPDRTLISIPNGKLADLRTESYAARDRFRLRTTLGLTYSTTHEQMAQVLAGVEKSLREHPHIWPDVVVVKFAGLGASSLDIDVVAWFAVSTWGEFLTCRQEVLLAIMKVVQDAGTDFAFPTQTVHLVKAVQA